SGFVETLTSACDAIDYKKLRDVQKKARASGRLFGIGVATYAELTGIGSRISAAPGMPINTGTETATLRFDSTGAIPGMFGTASHGQGLETTLAQVIADELGARIEDIRIVQGDSAAVAHGTGSYASRSAVLAGGAAVLASPLLKEKGGRTASHLLEASSEDIGLAWGRGFVVGTDRRNGARLPAICPDTVGARDEADDLDWLESRRPRIDRIRPYIADDLGLEGADPAVQVERQFSFDDLIEAVACRHQVL